MSSFTGDAWILSDDGVEIPVLNHPNEHFEFESILEISEKYGSESDKETVSQYRQTPNKELKRMVMFRYNRKWTKIRSWEMNRLLTVRIYEYNDCWKEIIAGFIINHPEFKSSEIEIIEEKCCSFFQKRCYYDN